MSEELRKEVLDYLGSHTVAVMATSKQDNPRAASVLYAHDGFNIIVHTIAGTAKVRIVETNPNVAHSICLNNSALSLKWHDYSNRHFPLMGTRVGHNRNN